MFTGIIQSLGNVEYIDYNKKIFCIKTILDLSDCKIGSSICCDGVCLTVIKIEYENLNYLFNINIGEETFMRSNLNNWKKGTVINIEKSLKVGDELGGHFVYGHVDTTLSLIKIDKLVSSWNFKFSLNAKDKNLDFSKYIVEKGSISINGISLTVANVYEDSFTISIIPHTFENTNLSILNEGDKVNIEFDPLARYISDKYGK